MIKATAFCLAIDLVLSKLTKPKVNEPECDICMDFDTNEYPNIFVSRK